MLDAEAITDAFGMGFMWGAASLGTAILIRHLYRLFHK